MCCPGFNISWEISEDLFMVHNKDSSLKKKLCRVSSKTAVLSRTIGMNV